MESTTDSSVRQAARSRTGDGSREAAPEGVCLAQYVDRIAAELNERVEHQRAVLRQVLAEGCTGKEGIGYCPLVDCPRIDALRRALRETVEVLEETRSAFKSKRLEMMRRKLIEVLAKS